MEKIKKFFLEDDALMLVGDPEIGGLRDHEFRVSMLLWLFLGIFGAHRFYNHHYVTGLLMLLSLGGFGLWWIADFFFMDFILHRRKRRNAPLAN